MWGHASRSHVKKYFDLDHLELAQSYWNEIGATAMVIVHQKRIIAEWGDVAQPIECYSVRKSFLSALFGIHVASGEIDLLGTLGELDIDDSVPPCLTKDEKDANIQELLMGRSGVYHPAAYETQGMKAMRPERGSHEHGTFWYYNNWDFNVLGTIFFNLTHKTVFDAFYEEIAVPTHMQDFHRSDGHFEFEYDLSDHPAYAFQVSARDRARFGQLFLDEGKWNNQSVIPLNWARTSTSYHTRTTNGDGYGYMWWVSNNGWHFGYNMGVRNKRQPFSAQGNHGQYIIVIPSRDLVVVQAVDWDSDDDDYDDSKFEKFVELFVGAFRDY